MRFQRPGDGGHQLDEDPRLESWDAKDHPAQLSLAAYVEGVAELVGIPEEARALALDLRVALPEHRPLTSGGGDLDNYLLPIIRRLGADRFLAAFASKAHGVGSVVTVVPARPSADVLPAQMTVRTTASASSAAWKAQVNAACAAVSPQPGDGPLSVDILFRLSGARNWSTLWKPAIDALGPLLGVANPQRPFMPQDDRIVQLGLHRVVDESLGWNIDLQVWWADVAGSP